ncbi:MAG: aspartate aminotransferase family protein, partial [Chloroflexi bacterium]|nr:aspartate aminotransferase family protein [Chloroflexota bacterium]
MVTPIEQRYIDMHPGSAERHAKAKDIFPDGVTHDGRRMAPFPIYATHGVGPHKWDVDGNRIIDYWTGHGSMILGHSHPEIVAAVASQIGKGTHLSASSDLEIKWGQQVIDLIPSAEKVRFHSSGTEATMMAVRMARAYTNKTKIIKFEEHFHGWSDGLSAGSAGLGGIPQESLDTMIVLPVNDISIVEKTLEGNDDIAAIILEPTGAHMGQFPVRPSFLNELRELTDRTGVVLIFDEVVTGFRIAKGGAQEYYGVTPDMTTMAKILGGGLPGGAVAGKADIINMIEARDDADFNQNRRIAHNGTFNANPLSAAAGTTALDLIMNTPINEMADAMGARLKDGLNDLLSRMEIPGCASGIASLIFLRLGVDHECDKGVCIMTPEQLRAGNNAQRNSQFVISMLNNGVHATSRFIMSAAHREQDIDETVEATEKSLTELRQMGL